jgi:hypothetical protein
VGVCAPNVGSKIGADVVFDDLTPFPGWLQEFVTARRNPVGDPCSRALG